MSAWLCYLIAVGYGLASLGKFLEAKTEHDVWLAIMLLCYSVASVALGRIT